MSKKIQIIVGFAISAFFLWLAFRSIDFGALKTAFAQVNWIWVLPFVGLTLLQLWWRGLRWRVFLEPQKDIPANRLFGPLMVGLGLNGVIPARAGEFARALALSKQEGVPFPAGFSTIVLERLLDAMTLLALFAIVPMFLSLDQAAEQRWTPTELLPPGVLNALLAAALAGFGAWAMWKAAKGGSDAASPGRIRAAWGALGLAGIAGAVLVLAHPVFKPSTGPPREIVLNAETLEKIGRNTTIFVGVLLVGIVLVLLPPVQRLTRAVILGAPLVPQGARDFVLSLFTRFTEGFHALRSPRAIALSVGHSVFIWLLGSFTFQVMSWGIPGFEMTFWHALAFQVITCIAIALPSAPGFWGLYEAGGVIACLLLGLVPSTPAGIATALSFTIICHFFQWAPITAIGLWYAAAIHVGASDAAEAKAAAEAAPSQG